MEEQESNSGAIFAVHEGCPSQEYMDLESLMGEAVSSGWMIYKASAECTTLLSINHHVQRNKRYYPLRYSLEFRAESMVS